MYVMKQIEGGGDSLFKSMYYLLSDLKEEVGEFQMPDHHLELRKELVQHLLENEKKYGFKLDKIQQRKYKLMKTAGILPGEEVLFALCDIYQIEVWVHHGMIAPVAYKADNPDRKRRIVHLQCISGVHYNPVICRRQEINEELKININVLENLDLKTEFKRTIVQDDESSEQIQMLVENIVRSANASITQKI